MKNFKENFSSVKPNSIDNLRFWWGYYTGSLDDFVKATGLKIHKWQMGVRGVPIKHNEIWGKLNNGPVFKIYDHGYCTNYDYKTGIRSAELTFDTANTNVFHIATETEEDTQRLINEIDNMRYELVCHPEKYDKIGQFTAHIDIT